MIPLRGTSPAPVPGSGWGAGGHGGFTISRIEGEDGVLYFHFDLVNCSLLVNGIPKVSLSSSTRCNLALDTSLTLIIWC